MAVTTIGWLLNNLRQTHKHAIRYNVYPGVFLQTREYAARKGTRVKALKKKQKQVVKKMEFVPFKLKLAQKKEGTFDAYIDDQWKPLPPDDVWSARWFQEKIYPFAEAIECHRETHHPTMYNIPDAYVRAFIELNMQGKKKTKFLDAFTRTVDVPNKYEDHEDRTILAFCKTPEQKNISMKAGATLAGGTELIRHIQTGELGLKEYDYVVAHTDILSELLVIKGLLKKNFPNINTGTLDVNMERLVKKFRWGTVYTALPYPQQKNYGTIDVIFGTLDMDSKELEENFTAVIQDVEMRRPLPNQEFIKRVRICSPPTKEAFKIDYKQYLTIKTTEKEEADAAVTASN